jgi:hypothetical protein
MFIVYEVWCLELNQVFYVGKGKDVDERHQQHLKAARRKKNGPAFHKKLRSMIECGAPYEFRVVFESPHEADAIAEERRRITSYGRRDLETGPLLNLTDGGEGSSGRVPEATRAIWREQRKGRKPWVFGKKFKQKKPHPRKGKTWTEAQRAASNARTPETRARRYAKWKETYVPPVKPDEVIAALKERMSGSGNPNYGKVGYFAGKVGPWAGKSHPNKGRKKGPDGKLYAPDELLRKFGEGINDIVPSQ